jgi:hypothetical protein
MDEIQKYFEKKVKITDEDWRVFSSKLVRKQFPRKTTLLKSGLTENYLSFIEKGIIHFILQNRKVILRFLFLSKMNFRVHTTLFLLRLLVFII